VLVAAFKIFISLLVRTLKYFQYLASSLLNLYEKHSVNGKTLNENNKNTLLHHCFSFVYIANCELKGGL